MHIGAGLVTVATSDVCSIATLSNGKDIQQTVVKKTGWQRFEAISSSKKVGPLDHGFYRFL